MWCWRVSHASEYHNTTVFVDADDGCQAPFSFQRRKTTLILRPIEAENGRSLHSTTQAMGFYE
jgi:hypothetical protein